MSEAVHEPCGNEDCDKCDPRPRWRVTEHRIQHITYKREIKAATREEAMQIFEAGTAWPSSYDDSYGEIVQQDEPVIVQITGEGDDDQSDIDARKLKYHREECCWNAPEHKQAMAEFLSRGSEPDEFADGDPVDNDSTKEFTK